jgi:3-oxoacyl-(acyl-carrier-protein) synthase
MAGCVNFSRRFYDETLKDPATASPLIFPETVFNAPASHLGALLGSNGINYTLVGDPGTFLQGLALAADWLLSGRVDGCLLIGAEELDWLVAGAFHLFDPKGTISEGAGALYLRRDFAAGGSVELQAITQSYPFTNKRARAEAALRARAELGNAPADSLLCDGIQGLARLDCDESEAWSDWTGARQSPKTLFGEGFMAAAAWQCVTAVDALGCDSYASANVSIVGCNQQAIAARFGRSTI